MSLFLFVRHKTLHKTMKIVVEMKLKCFDEFIFQPIKFVVAKGYLMCGNCILQVVVSNVDYRVLIIPFSIKTDQSSCMINV